MSIILKSDEAVQRVLKRLRKTKEFALKSDADDSRKHQLESLFQTIEEHLRRMDAVLPQVKGIEKQLLERFTTLEREIDDDIYKRHEKVDEIVQSLEKVVEDVQGLEKVVKDVQGLEKVVEEHIKSAKLQLKHATSSTSVMKHEESSEVQSRMASEEWSQLIPDETFFRSEALQSFWRNFNALANNYQLCLLSLTIFPENVLIKKRPIIYWWIGEGFIADDGNRHTAEEVGDILFQKLINRRFIKAECGNKSPITDSCTLPPWTRSLLMLIARQAEVFHFDDDTGRPRSDQRQGFLMSGNQDLHHDHNGNGNKWENVVTVYNINQKYLTIDADLLSRWKKLAVLQLGRWRTSPEHHIEIEKESSLNGLKALKHLRYLSLRGISRVVTLPRYLTQLTSLEILDLRACHNLEKLPSDISSLKNLTHLDVSECYLLESMPNGLEKLSKLQVLKGFIVEDTSKASCTISDLVGLKKLRKLSIHTRTKAVGQEQEFKKLGEIESLRILTISWGEASSMPNLKAQMDSTVLPRELKKLDLRYLPEDALPEWVDLRNLEALEKLYISGGKLKSLRYVEPEQFNNIKILRLKYLKGLTVTESQLRQMFPHATYLEAMKCRGDNIMRKD